MTNPTDGGHAFPSPPYDKGMSLRDYFAGQVVAEALQLLDFMDDTSAAAAAKYAYQVADAMLAARTGEAK